MASKKTRHLTPDEHKLWQKVTENVSPKRASTGDSAASGIKKKSQQKPVHRDDAAELERLSEVSRNTSLAYKQLNNGIKGLKNGNKTANGASRDLIPFDKRLKSKIARGRQPIDGTLDLHGLRQHDAHRELVRFLRGAYANGWNTLLVITGKGLRENRADCAPLVSDERGVLRRKVPIWLSEASLRHIVLGFEQAERHHGGSGALYVRLRKNKAIT
ncbi:MAG: Smr/MutS family protein [Pseudomonadota bacterium]